ncbi:MAG: mannonate dehydratase [Planctomycetota bacterium]|jgi:mannonate dehydratase|nr:mannonate dehydratase [Planctomycetota bacterium]
MTIQDWLSWTQLDDERLSFYKAIGVDMICLDIRSMHRDDPSLDLRDGRDSTGFFLEAKAKVESHGMELFSIFMAGWDEITFGMPDRDEKIDAWCQMLHCIGKAEIPALGYNFKPMGNFRTTSAAGRGGTSYSTFDYSEFQKNRPKLHEPEVTEEEMWEHMEHFLERVIPAAEEAGVRMALHPDDPPIPEPLGGVAQIVSTLDQYRRIFDASISDSNGMLFCQGCVTEMGVDVYESIHEMASSNKIVFVHFRNVRGALPSFQEVFLDEGDIDMHKALTIYRDAGFNGPFMMDHSPRFPSGQTDTAGKAYAVGYIRALLQTVYQ